METYRKMLTAIIGDTVFGSGTGLEGLLLEMVRVCGPLPSYMEKILGKELPTEDRSDPL